MKNNYLEMKILVIDDEASQREILADILSDAGYTVITAEDGEKGLELLQQSNCLLVLTDLKMPGMDGLEVLKKARRFDPEIQVILMTAFGSIPSAVNAIKGGAYDYLTKPFNKENLLRVIQRAADKISLILENRRLKEQVTQNYQYHQLLGHSPAMQQVFQIIERIKDVNATVLITGESGTGKELVARAIHFQGLRSKYPFIAVNCGAIPDTLIESELFGYTRGAFTGATRNYAGKSEQAQLGTIFLDEIGVMPPQLQVRLLRVLQEKKINRLGSNQDVELDVRIIAATNEQLDEKIQEGKFRLDLYHRLKIFSIHLPPLRERIGDLPLLSKHFIQKFSEHYQRMNIRLTPAALKRLEKYDFPGNVRELENIIEKAILLSDSQTISPESLMFEESSSLKKGGRLLTSTLPQIEREMIVEALKSSRGSITIAAKKLGISFKTLQYRIKKYGLDKTDFKNKNY
jgi:DNA-binding NtrC family response regulator